MIKYIVFMFGLLLFSSCNENESESFITKEMKNYISNNVDGSYGSNDNGIFFFTPDGKYIEWTGTYLYSDIPFEVKDTVVTYKEVQ